MVSIMPYISLENFPFWRRKQIQNSAVARHASICLEHKSSCPFLTMSGKKRASPGADVEKNPLANVELNNEDAQKLQDIQKDIQRVELVIGELPSVWPESQEKAVTQIDNFQERQAMEKLTPVYEKRRAVAKSIEKFWPVALMNNSMISFHAQHTIDQLALSYLEDLWIVRDPKEPRCYTIEFVRHC